MLKELSPAPETSLTTPGSMPKGIYTTLHTRISGTPAPAHVHSTTVGAPVIEPVSKGGSVHAMASTGKGRSTGNSVSQAIDRLSGVYYKKQSHRSLGELANKGDLTAFYELCNRAEQGTKSAREVIAGLKVENLINSAIRYWSFLPWHFLARFLDYGNDKVAKIAHRLDLNTFRIGSVGDPRALDFLAEAVQRGSQKAMTIRFFC